MKIINVCSLSLFCSISVWAQKEIRKFPVRETRIMSGSAEKCFHDPAQKRTK